MIFIWIFCLVFRTLRRREVWASVFLTLVFIKRLCQQHFFGKKQCFSCEITIELFYKNHHKRDRDVSYTVEHNSKSISYKCFFYIQNFYNQSQTEMGTKSSKC